MSLFKLGASKKLSDDVLGLLSQKKELEVEVKHIKQELDHARREMQMAQKEEGHTHKLELKSAEKKHELEKQEITMLLKLEGEQKIKQAQVDAQRKIGDLQTQYSKDISDLERRLSREYYEKLQTALTELHTKGNITTQFMQELTMKLLDASPKLTKSRIKIEQKALKEGDK